MSRVLDPDGHRTQGLGNAGDQGLDLFAGGAFDGQHGRSGGFGDDSLVGGDLAASRPDQAGDGQNQAHPSRGLFLIDDPRCGVDQDPGCVDGQKALGMAGVSHECVSGERHPQVAGVLEGGDLGQDDPGHAGFGVFGLPQHRLSAGVREEVQLLAVDGQQLGGHGPQEALGLLVVGTQGVHEFGVIADFLKDLGPRGGLPCEKEGVRLLLRG